MQEEKALLGGPYASFGWATGNVKWKRLPLYPVFLARGRIWCCEAGGSNRTREEVILGVILNSGVREVNKMSQVDVVPVVLDEAVEKLGSVPTQS